MDITIAVVPSSTANPTAMITPARALPSTLLGVLRSGFPEDEGIISGVVGCEEGVGSSNGTVPKAIEMSVSFGMLVERILRRGSTRVLVPEELLSERGTCSSTCCTKTFSFSNGISWARFWDS